MDRQHSKLTMSWQWSGRKKKRLSCLSLTILKYFPRNGNVLEIFF